MEVLELALGFWLFIFSKMFRENCFFEYRKSGIFGKFLIILSSLVSVVFGLAIPLLILVWVLKL